VCGNPARTDLGGGRLVMIVPTALHAELSSSRASAALCSAAESAIKEAIRLYGITDAEQQKRLAAQRLRYLKCPWDWCVNTPGARGGSPWARTCCLLRPSPLGPDNKAVPNSVKRFRLYRKKRSPGRAPGLGTR
jgi:hypothetical protein